MRLLATMTSLIVLLAGPAFGQSSNATGTGNPAGMTLGTGLQQPNTPDRLFVRAAAIGGMAEVEFGELAQQKAQDDAVKEFARRMVEDHGKANDRLTSIAKDAGIALPDEMDAEHQAMRDRLTEASGAAFDLVYLQGQIADHQKTAQLLEYEIGSGQQMELKNFASQVLPVVLQHLRSAQSIQAEVTGKAL
jgi:putative membrane protein